MLYRRLRELMGEKGANEGFAEAARALDRHLKDMRGAGLDVTAGPFAHLAKLPVQVSDAADLADLVAKNPGRLV